MDLKPNFLKRNTTTISNMTVTIVCTAAVLYTLSCQNNKIDGTYNIIKEVVNQRKAYLAGKK